MFHRKFTSAAPDRMLRTLFVLASLVSAAFLFATSFLWWTETPRGLAWQFNLGVENNLAAWWAGALLAAIALFASDGHARLKQRDADAARAWLVIAGIVLFLSLSEIGSMHERLYMWGDAFGLGSWGFVLPVGALLGCAFLWAAVQLWRVGPGERRRLAILMLGFAVFGSVVVQEYLEHAVDWGGPVALAIRVTVEEGSELLGMLILLKIAMGNTVHSPERPFAFVDGAWKPLGVASLLLVPVLLSLTIWHPGDWPAWLLGNPIDWLAAVIFLAAAAMAGRRILAGTPRLTDWALVLLLGMASAASVAVNPAKIVEIGAFEFGGRAVVLGALAAAIAAIWVAMTEKLGTETVMLLAAALLFLLSPAMPLSAHLFPVLMAFAAYAGTRPFADSVETLHPAAVRRT